MSPTWERAIEASYFNGWWYLKFLGPYLHLSVSCFFQICKPNTLALSSSFSGSLHVSLKSDICFLAWYKNYTFLDIKVVMACWYGILDWLILEYHCQWLISLSEVICWSSSLYEVSLTLQPFCKGHSNFWIHTWKEAVFRAYWNFATDIPLSFMYAHSPSMYQHAGLASYNPSQNSLYLLWPWLSLRSNLWVLLAPLWSRTETSHCPTRFTACIYILAVLAWTLDTLPLKYTSIFFFHPFPQ